VITTALLTIAAVVAAALVVNAIYPAVGSSSNALVQMAHKTSARIGTQVNVVYATAELDASQVWQDTDGDGRFDVFVWVKNVGTERILGLENMDVFLGQEGDFQRVPYINDAGGTFPRWTYTLENGTEWRDSVTLKISVDYDSTLPSGEYFVTVVTPSGASADHYFSF
jgi:archaellum component FlaG (FlaF/FlaG flagellin family)